jgi:periplasmic protein TonB
MNDRNKKSSAIFTPSGCLTGDALMLLVSGSLSGNDFSMAQQHISDCPLCADAADGLRMWLNENNDGQPLPSASADKSPSGPEEITVDQTLLKAQKGARNGSAAYKFHMRTQSINERLKQRIHFYKQVEAVKHKRRIIRPYAWMGAAATVVLFLSIFYVFRLQKLSDLSNLAKQNEAVDALELFVPDSGKQLPETKIDLAQNQNAPPESRKKQISTIESVDAEANEITGILSVVEDSDIQNVTVSEESPAAAPVAAKSELAQKQTVQNEDSMFSIYKEEPTHVEGVVVTALGITRDKKSLGYSDKELKNSEVATSYEMKGIKSRTMEDIETEEAEIFMVVEQMPEFPGGQEKLHAFLTENIKYPESAKESGIQGTVYVTFIVRKDGRISNAKILRGIGADCDEEALRVVNKMPSWKPAKQRGKNVDVQFNLPIGFKLE